jgi:hypothetical protein
MKSPYRRGYQHPETGLLFWDVSCGKERWLDQEKFQEWKQKFRDANKKRYAEKHEEIRVQARKRRKDNWSILYPKKAEWVRKNKDQVREYKRKWYQQDKLKNPRKNNAKNSARQSRRNSQRLKEDPLFAMKLRLRKATSKAFYRAGYTKRSKTTEMLGCSWEEAKSHIESGFTDGMNWDNRSKWHIDHIIPLASAKNEDELKKLCHYTNLQPLWGRDNIIKSNKIPE